MSPFPSNPLKILRFFITGVITPLVWAIKYMLCWRLCINVKANLWFIKRFIYYLHSNQGMLHRLQKQLLWHEMINTPMWFFFARHNFVTFFLTQKVQIWAKRFSRKKDNWGIGFVNLRLWMLLMAGGDAMDNFASFLRRGSAKSAKSAKLGHLLLSLIGSGAFWEIKYWKELSQSSAKWALYQNTCSEFQKKFKHILVAPCVHTYEEMHL